MQELNMMEVEEVGGGIAWWVIGLAIAAAFMYFGGEGYATGDEIGGSKSWDF